MHKDVLQAISGIDLFPIIALLLFVSFFAGVLIWVVKMNKSDVEHMKNLPLEDDTEVFKQGESR